MSAGITSFAASLSAEGTFCSLLSRAWNVVSERTSASPRIVSGNGRIDVPCGCRVHRRLPVSTRRSGCLARIGKVRRPIGSGGAHLLRTRPADGCRQADSARPRSRTETGPAEKQAWHAPRSTPRAAIRNARPEVSDSWPWLFQPRAANRRYLHARPALLPALRRERAQWSACVGLTQYRRPQANTRSSRLCDQLGGATRVLADQPKPQPDRTENLNYVDISVG